MSHVVRLLCSHCAREADGAAGTVCNLRSIGARRRGTGSRLIPGTYAWIPMARSTAWEPCIRSTSTHTMHPLDEYA